MTTVEEAVQAVVARLGGLAPRGRRLMVALAGAPGAGKSTLAEAVVAALGPQAALMPMDGFHLDDSVLLRKGLLPRKGAPETFDAGGFAATLGRVAAGEHVYVPVFDRSREIAIAGVQEIRPEVTVAVVEGNYLCLSEAPWSALASLWDLSVFLDVPVPELERRLLKRWAGFGYSPGKAREKAEGNDIPNARRVALGRGPVDLVLPWSG
ncbi:nucleoside triphosphate hydrolase [Ponticoccus alexandrii]|uniref:Nucleoside/nucleotide kinase family protein n=1 Tax=Ponticoccus alexandrii TaxID=1943633 RepID=A0ABX7FAC9_9RHOB|nr:nucleoside triphosphate hydrolase [Ponticoccus alexandrii]ETA49757.1 nucleoside triphosphate hydrolase [Rhodobacteraceae bacterium PD-2]QRF67506.1 nucleoside/nucleotide kinase family protein [Ponticoccus alexandrii]